MAPADDPVTPAPASQRSMIASRMGVAGQGVHQPIGHTSGEDDHVGILHHLQCGLIASGAGDHDACPRSQTGPMGLRQGSGCGRLALERGEGKYHDLGGEDADFVEHAPVDGQGRLVVLQTAEQSNWPRHHATASSSRPARRSSAAEGRPRSMPSAGPIPTATGSQYETSR